MAINKDEIFLNRPEIKKEAARLHEMGYNCAQSVVCAMAPAIDLDADGAFVLAEGFGAGMGGMTETCGAVSGAVMALSQVESTGRDQIGSKAKTYKLSRELSARFASTNGSTVCRELKGIGTETGALRSCPGCIDDAIDLAVDILVEQGAHEADAR